MKPSLQISGPVYYADAHSPFGAIRLYSDGVGLLALDQPGGRWPRAMDDAWIEDSDLPALQQARQELEAYFAGRLREFAVPLALCGTGFQRKVWHALLKIPYGQTVSYSDIANDIGQPSAVRAVAMANARNPIAIIVPCHRVIGKNGALTGYSGGGVARKEALLRHEGVTV